MKASFRQTKTIKRLALIFVCWTLHSLYSSVLVYSNYYFNLRPIEWWLTVKTWLLSGYMWAALTPLIIWLARRFPVRQQQWLKPSLIHLNLGLGFGMLTAALFVFLHQLLLAPSKEPLFTSEAFIHLLTSNAQNNLPLYWIVVGLVHAFDYYRKYRERELTATQLETRLVQAQLDALRMQLHPHFLFNTLNSIAVLMRKDVSGAYRVLLQLSALLRIALSKNDAHEIPLRQELEFLERYLEIEQTRFRDRLTVHLEIDSTALAALVPQLIFQPLVENAIKHGIADRETDGVIEIRAARRNGAVVLQVSDNGPGLANFNGALIEGVGLSNTRARLEHLYNDGGSLELRNAAEGGLIVAATIPFHTRAIINGEVEQ